MLWKIPRCISVAESAKHGERMMCGFSVIIPARNEEHILPHLLKSLAVQTVSPREVIIVNDDSTDATIAVAQRYGVRVISAPARPRGWTGKSWACWTGARVAEGPVLLFLDADVRLIPSAIAQLWKTFERDGGLVSVQPYHVVEKAYEQLSSFFNVVLMMGTNCFSLLGRRLKPTGAFGPCIMCERSKYLELEGHKAVKGEIVEDISIGKLFQTENVKQTCYGGRDCVSFRMYSCGLKQMIEGWTRAMVLGAGKIRYLFFILITMWLSGSTAAVRCLILGIVEESPSFTNLSSYIGVGLYSMYAIQIWWMLRRVGRFSLFSALFYPFPLLFFHLLFLYSFIQTAVLRRVSWRGRKIRIE